MPQKPIDFKELPGMPSAVPPELQGKAQPPDVPPALRATLAAKDAITSLPSSVLGAMKLMSPTNIEGLSVSHPSAPALTNHAEDVVGDIPNNKAAMGTLADMGQGFVTGQDAHSLIGKVNQGDYAGAIGEGLTNALLGHFIHKVSKLHPEELQQHANNVAQLLEKNGGATYSLQHGDMGGKKGYAVSPFPETNVTLHPEADIPTQVSHFIEQHQDLLQHPNATVGVWKSPTGATQLEVSAVTPSKRGAIEAAKKYNQYSIYDLQHHQEIPTGGTGTAPLHPQISSIANELNAAEGRAPVHTVDSPPDARMQHIADAYDAAVHSPNSPEVQASYDALKRHIADQWDAATQKGGMQFEPFNETSIEAAYPNAEAMRNDAINNKHLFVNTGGDVPPDHPLAEVNPKTGLNYNIMFRGVHDYFGHAMTGNDFSPRGEENAYLTHSQMMSPEAQPAIFTETKGQNSWINKGPHLRNPFTNEVAVEGEPNYVPTEQRPYPEQKATLLPEHFLGNDLASRLNDIDFGPQKDFWSGRHFSNVKTDVLSGARRGLAEPGQKPAGAEWQRVQNSSLVAPHTAPPGVYFYDEGTAAEPQIGTRKHEYQLSGNYAIADLADPKVQDIWKGAGMPAYNDILQKSGGINTQANWAFQNAGERALADAGYDGYRHSESQVPNAVFMFGDHKVSPVGETPQQYAPRVATKPYLDASGEVVWPGGKNYTNTNAAEIEAFKQKHGIRDEGLMNFNSDEMNAKTPALAEQHVPGFNQRPEAARANAEDVNAQDLQVEYLKRFLSGDPNLDAFIAATKPNSLASETLK